jgi:ABC-type dipeptide/oligopeptide/nickel transport system permease subunit
MSAPSASAAARRDVWRRFRRNRLGVLGAVIVFVLVVMAAFARALAPKDPAQQNLRARRAAPDLIAPLTGGKTTGYPLGADEFGRDILSRVSPGPRASLAGALASVAMGLTLGSLLGAVAGYVGGWVDQLVMRTRDLFLAFPYLLLAIVIVYLLAEPAGMTLMGQTLVDTLVTVLFAPVGTVVMTVYLYDQMVRRDGFDLPAPEPVSEPAPSPWGPGTPNA